MNTLIQTNGINLSIGLALELDLLNGIDLPEIELYDQLNN